MPRISDEALRALLAADPEIGWRAFIDDYTPLLLALIERAGVTKRDEAMEVYVLVCERLAENDCARLRQRDPGKGALGAWLSVVVRNMVVDWVRSRAGRRRLFGSVRDLSRSDQRVFELYYWEDRTPSEIVEILRMEQFGRITLLDVLDALDRIHGVLTERHHSELISMTVRSRPMASVDEELAAGAEVRDEAAGPEARAAAREAHVRLEAALAALPPEDAAIVRLKYLQGLSLEQIRRALHLDRLGDDRLAGIMRRLRARLTEGPPTPGSGVLAFEGGEG